MMQIARAGLCYDGSMNQRSSNESTKQPDPNEKTGKRIMVNSLALLFTAVVVVIVPYLGRRFNNVEGSFATIVFIAAALALGEKYLGEQEYARMLGFCGLWLAVIGSFLTVLSSLQKPC